MTAVCRNCGDANFASLDQYVATCDGEVEVGVNGELSFEPGGYTEIAWDSCEQIGWQCQSCYETCEVPGDAGGERDEILSALLSDLVIDYGEYAKRKAGES